MQITFLGTGTSQGIPVIGCTCPVCTSSDPKDKRLRCSLLLSYNEKNYVIDVGPDFRQQMLRHEVSNLESVFLSHEHNDHVIGLDDLRPFIFRQKKEMKIFGLPRVLEEIKGRFSYAFQDSPYPGIPRFELEKFTAGEKISISGLEVVGIGVDHGALPILGFRFGTFAYLTDVKSIDNKNRELLKGVELLVVSAIRQERPHHSHLLLEEAIQLIKELKVPNALIIHMSHYMGKHEDVEKLLPPNIRLAYDGLSLNLA